MIEIVPNGPQFFEFIRLLRNDDRVRQGFLDQTPISPDQQAAYMAEHAHLYLIALVDGEPAGYVGSVDDDIRVCTHPDYQGVGVGRTLVKAIVDRFPNSRARVKVDNAASLRLFESCGFTPSLILLDPPVDERSLGDLEL